MINYEKIICALDLNDLDRASLLIENIKYDIVYKVGMEFFYNFGFDGINVLKKKKKNLKIFLDLKLHDIPNTVSMSLKPLIKFVKPFMITLHIAGGEKMLNEAVYVVNNLSKNWDHRPMTIGVTILTSLSQRDLDNLGHRKPLKDYVLKYAKIANKAGLDGIVCSPLEITFIKELFGNKLKIITPGIRLDKSKKNDQSRVLTPEKAFQAGSDFIVMGRTLLNSDNPNSIIENIFN